MAKDADRIAALEAKVTALEDFNKKLNWAATAAKAAWATSGLSVLVVIVFVWNYATMVSSVNQHEKELTKLDGRFDKATEKLDAKIDRIASRLQSWEDKGFRVTHVAMRQGEFIALEGMTIAIKEDDQLHVFTVNPSLKINLNGKDVELKAAKLAPKTPIQFVVGDDNVQVIVITIEATLKQK
jgi:hypothetical protein